MSHKTLFVLGAGASKPYGFPLGSELISLIQTHNDSLWLPEQIDNLATFSKCISSISEADLSLRMNELAIGRYYLGSGPSLQLWNGRYWNNRYTQKQTSVFIDLLDLQNDIKRRQPLSIDRFLKDYDQHQLVGKIFIAYEILKNHKEFITNLESNYHANDNWYKFLAHDIQDHLASNLFRIITFNYDTSLEYFLDHNYDTLRHIKEKDLENFKENNIVHVYGKINYRDKFNPSDLTEIKSGMTTKIGEDSFSMLNNTMELIHACQASNGINLMRDGVYPNDKKQLIDTYIREADKIIFIGFGFDELNIRVLFGDDNLKLNKVKLNANLALKQIFLFNYGGEMQFVTRFFNDVFRAEQERPRHIEYRGNNLSDFYSNVAKTIKFDL